MERETWWARLDLVAISGGFLCPYDQIDSKLAKSEKLLPTTGWSADSVSALFCVRKYTHCQSTTKIISTVTNR